MIGNDAGRDAPPHRRPASAAAGHSRLGRTLDQHAVVVVPVAAAIAAAFPGRGRLAATAEPSSGADALDGLARATAFTADLRGRSRAECHGLYVTLCLVLVLVLFLLIVFVVFV